VWFVRRSSDGGTSAQQWGLTTDLPAPGDFDGDGKADIAVFRDGNWYILRSWSNQLHAPHWGQAGDQPVPAANNPSGAVKR
ncbi:MAG: VCBS repeat-containing protein, partial [Acidobacteria bacterium]|nr:VCBS repeat-containing protein [Acidobacteriota bacterium]